MSTGIEFLNDIAEFVKDHYDPWLNVPRDDISLWLMRTYQEGTFIPIISGSGNKGEIIAFYEYWLIKQSYVDRMKKNTGQEFIMPDDGERDGDILFIPIAVIHSDYRDKTFSLSRIVQQKFMEEFPNAPGLYRWVLKDQRLRFMPWRRKDDGSS